MGSAARKTRGRVANSIRPFGKGRGAVVIGAGPGGMAAALLLRRAGFDVTLFEAQDQIGGGLIVSAAPPFKDKLLWYLDYLRGAVGRAGIRLVVGEAATPDSVRPVDPAVIILATGARARGEDRETWKGLDVHHAYDLLAGGDQARSWADKTVLVYGGGETGCETAEYLAERGAFVTLASRSDEAALARSAEHFYRRQLSERLRANNRIALMTDTELLAVSAKHVRLKSGTIPEMEMAVDRVVIAQGRTSGTPLAEALKDLGFPIFTIGDVRQIGRIGDAVHDAYRVVHALAAEELASMAEAS